MLSRNLEDTIHRAMAYAGERRHEFSTLEHLLLSLAEDQDAVAVLRACGVDMDKLRDDLIGYLDNELDYLISETHEDPRPTDSFTRALQRAAIHVQSSGREEVTGANVLVAIFSERESHAAGFLRERGMSLSLLPDFRSSHVPGRGMRSKSGHAADTEPEPPTVGASPTHIRLTAGLEETLHRALAHAEARRHEFSTLEHLLLSLAEDQDAVAVLRACGVDMDKLRGDLVGYLDNELDYLITETHVDPRPTDSFTRALQRAAIQVQSVGGGEINGASVLVAIFSEQESQAVFFLQEQDMTRFDVVNCVVYGLAKKGGQGNSPGNAGGDDNLRGPQ